MKLPAAGDLRPSRARARHLLAARPALALVLMVLTFSAGALLPLDTSRTVEADDDLSWAVPRLEGEHVYDAQGQLEIGTQQQLESTAVRWQADENIELVIYIHRLTGRADDEITASRAEGLRAAWEIGEEADQVGVLLLVELDTDAYRRPSRMTHRTALPGEFYIAAGPGLAGARLSGAEQREIDQRAFDRYAANDLDRALVEALSHLKPALLSGASGGIVLVSDDQWAGWAAVAILALTGLLCLALWLNLLRQSRYSESSSILMAGPPSDLEPTVASVLMQKRATHSTLITAVLGLASQRKVACELAGDVYRIVPAETDGSPTANQLTLLQQRLLTQIQNLTANGQAVQLQQLEATAFLREAEEQTVALGFLRRPPPHQAALYGQVAGAAVLLMGLVLSGLVLATSFFASLRGYNLLGFSLIGAGLAVWLLAPHLTRRSRRGRWLSSMLASYRDILIDALSTCASLREVAELPLLRGLLVNPSQVVVWSVALGIRGQLEPLLAKDDLAAFLPLPAGGIEWADPASLRL